MATPKSLHNVNRKTSYRDLSKLRFFANLMDKRLVATLDRVDNVQGVHQALKGRFSGDDSAELLQSMLHVVGVDVEAVKVLLPNKEIDLTAMKKKYKQFAFGEMMVTLCNTLSDDMFKDLKELFSNDHSERRDDIKAADELFLVLIRAGIIAPANLNKLLENLETVGAAENCASLVKKFVEEHGKRREHGTDNEKVNDKHDHDVPGKVDHAAIEQAGNEDCSAVEQRNINGNQVPETDGENKPFRRKMSQSDCTMVHTPTLTHFDDEKKKPVPAAKVSRPESLAGFYPMNEHEHGLAVIISIENIEGRDQPRGGTRIDEENLRETFRFLGYRVDIRRNCKKADIDTLFETTISSKVKKEDDSFVCCILSHGGNNYFRSADDKLVFLRTEESSLEMKLRAHENLKEKPKLFFMSCCRGTAPIAHGEKDSDPKWVSKRADFAFYYSTLTRNESTRYKEKGTIYINKLCHWLCKHATNTTLSDIHKLVAREVSDVRVEGAEEPQVPCSEEQFLYNVYFFEDMVNYPQYS